jgi:antitoxin (DNA-binding transcriptional repressor) of toxin-antitoxin stability system
MPTRTIDITEARSQLAVLLDLALAGTEIVIVAGDRPVVKVVPLASGQGQRIAGLNEGTAWVSDDFDDPLPDSFWLGEEETDERAR